jgi:selenide,water dikinase
LSRQVGSGDLSRALADLPVITDPRLIVGRETFDDAGVFVVSDDLALVQTVDFFAPIVDDPYLFGQIAAARRVVRCLRDGRRVRSPRSTSSAFRRESGRSRCSRRFFAGGQDKVHEAVRSSLVATPSSTKKLKFGLSVTGRVHPRRVLSNANARVGRSAGAH